MVTTLLNQDDVSPFIVENEGAASPFVLICDHAGRSVPHRLGRLGVAEAEFERHIAWDIGAGALCSKLSADLDAVAIRQLYSRLVIDCNRPPDSPALILETSDGTTIPANIGLSGAEKAQRLAEIHRPYHQRIGGILRDRVKSGRKHVLIFVHSFTPRLNGVARPWRYGVLHMGDSPLSAAVLARLRTALGDEAGDNEPYAMDGTDYSAPLHSRDSGFDYLELEVRQDLIADSGGQAAVASFLAQILRETVTS